MTVFELKVPPPVVALGIALAMWGTAQLTPAITVPPLLRTGLAMALLLIGLSFDAAGLLAFRRARTTINPLRPGRAKVLVTSGIYRITRNPMYVGLAFVLTAWAVFLAAPAALAGPPVFVLVITRLQVIPEERILVGLFGEPYEAYLRRVPRWL